MAVLLAMAKQQLFVFASDDANYNPAMNILERLPHSQLRPLMAPFGVVAVIIVAAWVVMALLRPMPQREASGPPHIDRP